jgi:hypothetical protein
VKVSTSPGETPIAVNAWLVSVSVLKLFISTSGTLLEYRVFSAYKISELLQLEDPTLICFTVIWRKLNPSFKVINDFVPRQPILVPNPPFIFNAATRDNTSGLATGISS